MIVTQIWLAALSRQDLPEAERRDFNLFIDEAPSIATESFSDMLAETRKYALSVTLASQFLDQWDLPLRAAIFGNVGTLITFRTGAEDAAYLAREFYPVFTEQDFVNIPQFEIKLKLLIDGVPSQGFSARTLPLQGQPTGNKQRVIERSRTRYGRTPPSDGTKQGQLAFTKGR